MPFQRIVRQKSKICPVQPGHTRTKIAWPLDFHSIVWTAQTELSFFISGRPEAPRPPRILKVMAPSLYDAVAQGLAAIRGNEWVAGIAQGLNVVRYPPPPFALSMRSG